MRKPSPGNWWSLGGAEAIQVGRVAVNVSDANLGRATAAFTMPELAPATYQLMLCDTACTEPLADVIPVKGFTVVADPATARMAQRVDRLERRSPNQAGQLAAARADTDRALAAALNARSEAKQLRASVSSLANEGRSSPLAAPWAYAGWLVTGALTGALALLVLRRRRSRRPRPARAVGWHPSDEELRELLSSESVYPARRIGPRRPSNAGRPSEIAPPLLLRASTRRLASGSSRSRRGRAPGVRPASRLTPAFLRDCGRLCEAGPLSRRSSKGAGPEGKRVTRGRRT